MRTPIAFTDKVGRGWVLREVVALFLQHPLPVRSNWHTLQMTMKTNKSPHRIGRRAGYQGSRPSGGYQPEDEKCATENNPPNTGLGLQQRVNPEAGPPQSPPTNNTRKAQRTKWTREDYREVMRAFYCAKHKPNNSSVTEETYKVWRSKVPNAREYMDANKLANVRRNIINKKYLTGAELTDLENCVKTEYEETPVESEGDNASGTQQNTREDEKTENLLPETQGSKETEQNPVSENNGRKEEIDEMRVNILRELAKTQNTSLEERENIPKIRHDAKMTNTISVVDKAIEDILKDTDLDLTTLNEIIYSAARVATSTQTHERKRTTVQSNKAPLWQRKIVKEIETMRSDLSIIEEVSRGVRVKNSKVRKITHKYRIIDNTDIPVIKETLKQRIQLKAQRKRRYEKRTRFYKQNNTFKSNKKKFYREIGETMKPVQKPPPKEEVRNFWNKIWGERSGYNKRAKWLENAEEKQRGMDEQQWDDIEVDEVQKALRKSQKWKSPGIDKVPNFWLNAFPSVHKPLAKLLSNAIKHPDQNPDWLTKGTTYLLPKNEETSNPKNYRPITCLSTMYKLITSISTERLYQFLDSNNILPEEQKGCKRGSYGCKDQLLINKMILENCHTKQKNLSTAWIDYKKAFDSVPHDWIIKSLQMLKVSPKFINFLRISMAKWNTTLHLNHVDGVVRCENIKINSGIFQGDSLSPLLFCIALIPLSAELNNTTYGYRLLGGTVNHLIYMDDLKLFAKNDKELEGLLRTVKDFSDDINMEFGIEKCAKATFKRGKLELTENIELDRHTVIRDLEQGGVYKYLGINEGRGIQHAEMKERIRKECIRRVRAINKTELNAKNKIEAINTLALPVVTYSFNIINWNLEDIRRIDRKLRKQLTIGRAHHPKADVDRLYLPRKEGGRGLINLELTYKTTTIGMEHYLKTTNDRYLKLVYQHEKSKKLHSVAKESQRYQQNMDLDDTDHNENPAKQAKEKKKKAKNEGLACLRASWGEKPLHGRYPTRTMDADVDRNLTHQWLRSSGLKPETEGFIVAAQDQSLPTRSYQARILKKGNDPKCRFCQQTEESVDHLITGCSTLAHTEYKNRHDRVGQYLHWKICRHYGLPCHEKWYEHKPPPVLEGKDVTLLWDFSVHTDRTIQANRPDIIIKDVRARKCLIIDMAVPSDKNISSKEFEKLSKYKDLEIEVTKMWRLNTTTVPVIVGALGMIGKTMGTHIKKIPGYPTLREIQKITLMGTAHILRKTLSIK